MAKVGTEREAEEVRLEESGIAKERRSQYDNVLVRTATYDM